MNQSSPNSTPDLTGECIGDYSLIRRLGRGGMADVYLALQTSLQRKVALKILKPDLAKDDSYVRRFLREAQAAAALVQANIVQIYEVGQADGYHFIAQEYVPGRNLRQHISRFGAVEPVMAINVLRQVSLALQKADEMDVIHRDIKPENIMISTIGEVKVTDFGLARVNNQRTRQDLTQIGITMGTPLYMSPEQVEGKEVDSRSDIYSLGITAYHMLAGRTPYEGDNALAVALQHVNASPEPLVDIRPDVPAELCQLIHRMIAKSPDDRPRDPNGLTKEIRKIKIAVDEDWEELVEKLADTDSVELEPTQELPQSKLAATRQLQAVMKGNISPQRRWPASWLLVGTLILFGFGLGSLNAMRTAPSDPLDVEDQLLNTVTQSQSIEEQYMTATWAKLSRVSDEEQESHWMAVVEFPILESDNEEVARNHRREARARLGELYTQQREWDKALKMYDDLADTADVVERFNAIGMAGRTIVFDLRSVEGSNADRERIEQMLRKLQEKMDSSPDLFKNRYYQVRVQDLIKKYLAPPTEL